MIFHGDELGWCTITDWGVDHGTNIVFYSPVNSKNPEADEEHASLSEVLTWIQQSPVHARISDYKSSRASKKSNTKDDVKVMMMRNLHLRRQRPRYGTMLTLTVNVNVPEIKILSTKTNSYIESSGDDV